jgi:4-cresol dehydrogenase (hydroxylating)
MRTPPGVAQAEFAVAIREFQGIVGSDWVYTADADVDLYRDAYSPFPGEAGEISVSAAVAPDSVEQVQQILRAANKHRIAIYPISTGRNLGPELVGSIVRHGVSIMPMFRKTELSDADLAVLAAYLARSR